jgi:hypothetical protein
LDEREWAAVTSDTRAGSHRPMYEMSTCREENARNMLFNIKFEKSISTAFLMEENSLNTCQIQRKPPVYRKESSRAS